MTSSSGSILRNTFFSLAAALALTGTPATLRAEDPAPSPDEAADKSVATDLNLLDAMRDGLVMANAVGDGDGRLTLSLTNKSNRRLNVVLPPGIVASGVSGQMGMMGGMGGGMGGGMMGGGMGGMGGGRMGGMGGGRMGGMGMSGRTMPPMMGMMMLGRLIMQLCGDYDSWDQRSLMSGMMGMRGGMGGGMMGGMGGGMMGGMGGMGGMGMMSVPPTGLPFAALKPGQKRELPTRLVSLSPAAADGSVAMPAKGESLRLGDVSTLRGGGQAGEALRRLALVKAPTRVAQMAMWNVAQGYDWDTIARLAKPWGNHYELTLAREFVDGLSERQDAEPGRLFFEGAAADDAARGRADEVTAALKDKMVIGLRATEGVPSAPEEPAVGCKVRLNGEEAVVQVAATGKLGRKWVPFGKFTVPTAKSGEEFDPKAFGDALAGGVLDRLVRATLSHGPREKGKPTYRIKVENASPLILNGLAIAGAAENEADAPRRLAGLGVPPRRALTVPASAQVVETLGLKDGVRIVAADLSGL